MEKELREIFDKHNQGWGMIDTEKVIEDILLLFSVSGAINVVGTKALDLKEPVVVGTRAI